MQALIWLNFYSTDFFSYKVYIKFELIKPINRIFFFKSSIYCIVDWHKGYNRAAQLVPSNCFLLWTKAQLYRWLERGLSNSELGTNSKVVDHMNWSEWAGFTASTYKSGKSCRWTIGKPKVLKDKKLLENILSCEIVSLNEDFEHQKLHD